MQHTCQMLILRLLRYARNVVPIPQYSHELCPSYGGFTKLFPPSPLQCSSPYSIYVLRIQVKEKRTNYVVITTEVPVCYPIVEK